TPAEEGGGGKVFMAREGALDGLSAAMMVHPADQDLATMDVIANQQVMVEYHGRASHAAAAPHQGINALDAAVIGYTAIAALRQHIKATERLHGVFLDGGDKPNIVPSHASMHWYVRAANMDDLELLKTRVLAALQAGALATGAEMTYEWQDPPYADMVTDDSLIELYCANAEQIGRSVALRTESPVMGSTDMGNVSHDVPSIHPMIAVAPPGVAIHTPDFAGFARGPEGDSAVVDGAKALACTVIDTWALHRQ
ncbi:MAG: M20/M25/M40 family metallo-hydrolase, partial [Microthrixaceae bacterium]